MQGPVNYLHVGAIISGVFRGYKILNTYQELCSSAMIGETFK